jgi:hypothetical protein
MGLGGRLEGPGRGGAVLACHGRGGVRACCAWSGRGQVVVEAAGRVVMLVLVSRYRCLCPRVDIAYGYGYVLYRPP